MNEPILQELQYPADKVLLYTDGACINNPGPGGYGIVLIHKNIRQEISGGFNLTTNNRMELIACISGLQAVSGQNQVILYSDSRYVIDGITKGWAKRWRSNGWKRNRRMFAENADLWAQFLDLCDQHQVEFVWIKGHGGNAENENCDRLAMQAASRKGLPADPGYPESRLADLPLFASKR